MKKFILPALGLLALAPAAALAKDDAARRFEHEGVTYSYTVTQVGDTRVISGVEERTGKPFTLKVGQSATLPDGNWLRFNRLVSDSRCPLDAICITAGDAIISVSFERGHLTQEFHTTAPQSRLSYAQYTIALTELQPYPQASRPASPDDYVATFVVQER